MANVLKTEKPFEELLKQHEHAQSMLGNRLQVPDENATPEQLKEFHKKLGVPETPDAYTLEPTKWDEADKQIGDYLNASRNETFMSKIKEAAHQYGVTPKALQGLVDAYDKAFAVEHKAAVMAQINADVELAKDFDVQSKKLFGNQASEIINRGNQLIDNSVPPEMKASIRSLDNNSQMVVATLLDHVYRKYVKEDNGIGTGAGTGVRTLTPEDVSAEGRRLMSLPGYSDITHPDHERIQRQLRDNYSRLNSLGKS